MLSHRTHDEEDKAFASGIVAETHTDRLILRIVWHTSRGTTSPTAVRSQIARLVLFGMRSGGLSNTWLESLVTGCLALRLQH